MSIPLRVIFLISSLCMPMLVQANSQSFFITDFNATAILAAVPVSKQQAAGIAQLYVPGRVLKITFDGSTYRVKIVSKSGDVVSVFVNGQTGEILKQ